MVRFDRVEEKPAKADRGVPRGARERHAAVEVRSRRVGGATYQVPVEVRTERRQALAIRWLISAARGRNENTMVERCPAS
jgi:small subunit ribosomal protein S7